MDTIVLFGRELPLYGILYFGGIFASALVALLLCRRKGIEKFDIICSGVYSVIGGVIGAKLLFIVVSIEQIVKLNIPLEAVIKGGFVFYGGLIGGAIGLFLYTREFHLDFYKLADIYATVLPLGHAIGRLGCHFAGCCYGMEYSGFPSVTYHQTRGTTPLGVSLLAVQLIEATALLILFAVSVYIYIRHCTKDGTVACVYIYSYTVMRFVLEFFRGDAERGVEILSTSQYISIFILVLFVSVKLHSTKNSQ